MSRNAREGVRRGSPPGADDGRRKGGNPMKKLTEKKRRDLEAFEALPPSIREYLLAYAAGMVAGAELKKKATA